MPKSFESVMLKELVLPIKTWNPKEQEEKGVFTYIDVGCIDNIKKEIVNPNQIDFESAPSRARQFVKKGDVLVSTVRPNLNAVAVVREHSQFDTASTGICVLRADEKRLCSGYLFHWVQTRRFVDSMMLKATGASYPAVSTKIVKDSFIPLPPLEEQKRIAAILDKADTIRRKRQRAIELADEFLRSIFLDLFGDPVTNPKGWDVVHLTSLLTSPPRNGTVVPASSDGILPIIKVGQLGAPKVNIKQCDKVNLSEKEKERFSVKAGDIVFARAIGSEKHLGKASIIENNCGEVVFDSHVMRISFDVHKIYPTFFWAWLNSFGGRSLFLKQSSRTAVQFNINAKQLGRIEIALPPLKIQQKFEAIFAHLDQMIRKLTADGKDEELFCSLQQKAFKGEL